MKGQKLATISRAHSRETMNEYTWENVMATKRLTPGCTDELVFRYLCTCRWSSPSCSGGSPRCSACRRWREDTWHIGTSRSHVCSSCTVTNAHITPCIKLSGTKSVLESQSSSSHTKLKDVWGATWCCDTETQMLKSGIINIWTCFPLSILAAFEEGQIKRPTREIPVVCTSYQPKRLQTEKSKANSDAFNSPCCHPYCSESLWRTYKSRGQISVGMLIGENREA